MTYNFREHALLKRYSIDVRELKYAKPHVLIQSYPLCAQFAISEFQKILGTSRKGLAATGPNSRTHLPHLENGPRSEVLCHKESEIWK